MSLISARPTWWKESTYLHSRAHGTCVLPHIHMPQKKQVNGFHQKLKNYLKPHQCKVWERQRERESTWPKALIKNSDDGTRRCPCLCFHHPWVMPPLLHLSCIYKWECTEVRDVCNVRNPWRTMWCWCADSKQLGSTSRSLYWFLR